MEIQGILKDRKKLILYSMIGILILSFVVVTVYLISEIDRLEEQILEIEADQVNDSVYLDFQNQSGASRIKSTFSDLVVASEGSRQRDNGYELSLAILNPTSARLQEIAVYFSRPDKSATCNDINFVLLPGRSRVLKCFFADLTKDEVSLVKVSIDFDKISF